MRWLVKNEHYMFKYNSSEDKDDTRWDQLSNAVASEARSEWEPWSIDVKHTFSTDYSVVTTTASVWFKRSDE